METQNKTDWEKMTERLGNNYNHMESKQIKKMNLLQEMENQEVWTNAFSDRFGERVCVGVTFPYCIREGKKFKPTTQEIKALWDDMIYNEFGSSEQIMRDLKEELGQ